ncbi:unnamed protein product [Schistocephalus solidus]|uniref:Reverse transcriptase domain-containing protein n=1 Tax=Schistocephalus solidus TaxID=70667 RepID=A0A183TKL9_SCHSO|nr:unnamed protein product [Schistocephalus solidus]
MIFIARHLQEKYQEMQVHLQPPFVDLTKAFDTVNRNGLWKMIQNFGCLERFTCMARQLHDGMMAHITDNGMVSEAFAVTNAGLARPSGLSAVYAFDCSQFCSIKRGSWSYGKSGTHPKFFDDQTASASGEFPSSLAFQ